MRVKVAIGSFLLGASYNDVCMVKVVCTHGDIALYILQFLQATANVSPG